MQAKHNSTLFCTQPLKSLIPATFLPKSPLSLQKWNKILRETEGGSLSNHQTFWRSVALLRLQRHQEALETFNTLPVHQTQSTDHQLHYCELLLKNRQTPLCQERLTQIFSTCQKDSKSKEQWNFIARRVKTPNSNLKQLLNRSPNTDTSYNYPTQPDWIKAQKLKRHQNQPNFYKAWLAWSLNNQPSNESIKSILKTTLSHCPKQSFLCHELFGLLNTHSTYWPTLIDELFLHAHKCQAQKSLMWKHWWKSCPKDQRPHLKNKMAKLLERSPQHDLEELFQTFKT